MARNPRLALDEILGEIEWVTSVVSGKSLADFTAGRATRYVVKRAIEIISEAARRIPADLKALPPGSIGVVSATSEIFSGTNITRPPGK